MKTYEATFASLSDFQCPEWYQDAKFGILSHWGAQSVPMCGDWYARQMYVEGSPQYRHHLRYYGHPSEFGYKDICALWKAESFHPEELMELYYRAGARFFLSQAMHHDHFFNYPSRYNRFNAMNIGPHKDICGLWRQQADRLGLPFGLMEHLGASFTWWRVNKGCDQYGPYAGVPYDGSDEAYGDFYHQNHEHFDGTADHRVWYTANRDFHEYWLKIVLELVDLYQPDILYTDGTLPFGSGSLPWESKSERSDSLYRYGLEAVAHLYNSSAAKHGKNRALYTQRDRRTEISGLGIVSLEKSQISDISPVPWQVDTCIGNWFYDTRQEYKKAEHILEILVDVISKNGVMTLNVLQRPDGSVDSEQLYILGELEKWFSVCGEGVYGTRPWRVFGEGERRASDESLNEAPVPWGDSDFRFTSKSGTVYAFMMRVPTSRAACLKSFGPEDTIRSVRLLGGEELEFSHAFGVLTVKLPERLPTKYVNCLAIGM